MRARLRGSAMLEFALAWPVALMLVLGAAQVALWASESFASRAAALAGARAATVAGASVDVGAKVAVQVLRPAIFGTSIDVSCGGDAGLGVRVCARELPGRVEVDVDGSVPALVPLIGARGLPVSAHVVLQKEQFVR